MSQMKGKVALVTGAGSGIGRGTAIALAEAGATVIAADVDEKGGRETCAAIAEAGGKARFQKLDVTREADWEALIASIGREFDRLDVLVNNAGICISKPVLEMSLELWRKQMAVNLDGVFIGTKAALPLMARAGGGSIVNISSVAGIRGIAGLAGYCASKAGVHLFTKAVALECARAKNGVRVNSIHPGAIETPIWLKLGHDGELPPGEHGVNEDRMEQVRANSARVTPVGHAGVPADIAAGVVFLASDAARFVTGTELVIDGGVAAG
jgi:NAD(P)-dependent dehydrogenase (short-subunit alcohol dehydrogenase family)